MRKSKLSAFRPVILLFVVLNALLIAGKSRLEAWGFDQDVVIIGNLLLFVVTTISFLLAQKGLKNPNPHAFTRAVFGSIILKLFVFMIAAFIYIAAYQKSLNKPALFTCMGLYLVYTFLEVSILTRMLRHKTNE